MTFQPSRRVFLGSVGALTGALLLPDVANGATSTDTVVPGLPTAAWLQAENLLPGTASWLHGLSAAPGALEAYCSTTSAPLGSSVQVFVSTPSPTISVSLYRMGYYQGLGARLVWSKNAVPARVQTMPKPDEFNTVDCNWTPTFSIAISSTWSPGQYLIRLDDASGKHRFVPLMIRDDASQATYVYLSAVTTWQAYNTWGGFSLYRQTDPLGWPVISNSARAQRVSFNRPYAHHFANGSADFVGNELPFLFLAEKLGLDMTYWTDIDLHEQPAALLRHKALLSLGHDEYYSLEMRNAVLRAVKAGVNVAFFGANFIYRKVRFESGVNGLNRLMVNYRSDADPIMATMPSQSTVNWPSFPDGASGVFSGSDYGGAQGVGSLKVVDATSWLWSGTGVSEGTILPNALGGEFNNYNPGAANPTNVQLLGHSRVGGGVSDVTYVATRAEGGVFCSGTGQWIYHLSSAPKLGSHWIPAASTNVTPVLTKATMNLLALFARGPAGSIQPSVANTATIYG